MLGEMCRLEWVPSRLHQTDLRPLTAAVTLPQVLQEYKPEDKLCTPLLCKTACTIQIPLLLRGRTNLLSQQDKKYGIMCELDLEIRALYLYDHTKCFFCIYRLLKGDLSHSYCSFFHMVVRFTKMSGRKGNFLYFFWARNRLYTESLNLKVVLGKFINIQQLLSSHFLENG